MRTVFVISILFLMGCTNTGRNSSTSTSIVGVWELTQLDIAKNGRRPIAPITNKKDIYTEKGIYHDTDAESIAITDASLRNYRIKNDKIEIYNEHETIRSSNFKMPNNDTLIIIVDEHGSELTFKRLSNKSWPIPPIKKKYAKILFDGIEFVAKKEVNPNKRRNFEIELLNIPIENIVKYKLQYDEKIIESMNFGGESSGDNGITYGYWLEGEIPEFVEFNISYKDGTVVQKRIEIPKNVFNRYGISSVLLDYAEGKHHLTFKYGIVSEKNPDIYFEFDKQGNIDRIFVSRTLSSNQISREYLRDNNNLYISMSSYVNSQKPYVYVRNGSDGKIKGIEVYHHNHPKRYRIYYSPTLKIISATTLIVPVGDLIGPTTEKKVEDFTELQSLEIPNLSFLEEMPFDLKKVLDNRGLILPK